MREAMPSLSLRVGEEAEPNCSSAKDERRSRVLRYIPVRISCVTLYQYIHTNEGRGARWRWGMGGETVGDRGSLCQPLGTNHLESFLGLPTELGSIAHMHEPS